MSRRVVLGRRDTGEYGLFVSRPGWDALNCPEDQLLMSTSRRHAMLVQSGFVTLGSSSSDGRWVPFVTYLSVAPLVFCGRLDRRPADEPVKVFVGNDGFWAHPEPVRGGTQPAAGKTVPYYVWMASG